MVNFGRLRLLVLDVDGILTDGRIGLSPEGGPLVGFHAQDGAAIKLWQRCGHLVAICSGRQNPAVTRRAHELGIGTVRMGLARKLDGYRDILTSLGCEDDEVVYLGDDCPDLQSMALAGLAVTVAGAVPTVKRAAGYITRRDGGEGAVAEAVEYILRKQGRWDRSVLLES